MIEFKVGDKVCDPVHGLNGIVYSTESGLNYPIFAQFDNGESFAYTYDGCAALQEKTTRLFHGHMEPGTGKVTFEPKKEPEYEWQWLKQDKNKWCETTAYYKSEDDCRERLNDTSILYRIEESKREIKP